MYAVLHNSCLPWAGSFFFICQNIQEKKNNGAKLKENILNVYFFLITRMRATLKKNIHCCEISLFLKVKKKMKVGWVQSRSDYTVAGVYIYLYVCKTGLCTRNSVRSVSCLAIVCRAAPFLSFSLPRSCQLDFPLFVFFVLSLWRLLLRITALRQINLPLAQLSRRSITLLPRCPISRVSSPSLLTIPNWSFLVRLRRHFLHKMSFDHFK